MKTPIATPQPTEYRKPMQRPDFGPATGVGSQAVQALQPAAAGPMVSPSVPPSVLSASNPAPGRRLAAAAAALAASTVLLVAAFLQPSGFGLGTHEQLGMPACGWVVTLDLPCPTCGMTTAFAHAADGNLLASLATQPMGCFLALVCAMVVLIGGYVAVTGSPLTGLLIKMWRPRVGWILTAGFVVAWVYKILSHKGVL